MSNITSIILGVTRGYNINLLFTNQLKYGIIDTIKERE